MCRRIDRAGSDHFCGQPLGATPNLFYFFLRPRSTLRTVSQEPHRQPPHSPSRDDLRSWLCAGRWPPKGVERASPVCCRQNDSSSNAPPHPEAARKEGHHRARESNRKARLLPMPRRLSSPRRGQTGAPRAARGAAFGRPPSAWRARPASSPPSAPRLPPPARARNNLTVASLPHAWPWCGSLPPGRAQVRSRIPNRGDHD